MSERHLAAILFTDIVGSTAATARSESAGLELRDRHRALVRGQVERYHGRFIEAPGDESLSTFESAVDAVHAALAIQQALRDETGLRVRAGLHLGETMFRGDEVFGDGVNIAARVRELAAAGEILASAEVAHAVQNQPHIETASRGEEQLKGVAHPVTLYALSGTAAEPGAAPERRARPVGAGARRLVLAVVAVLALASGVAWWMSERASAPAPIRSIAVLPLDNLSGDPEQEYFADGMTEALIASLAQISSLRVTSRTTVTQYRDRAGSLPEIADELGVDALLEGSVFRDGARVLVTVQLIDARRDEHLWAEQFERDLENVIGLQREIASSVAERVRAEVTPRETERLEERPAVMPQAQEAVMKGWYFAGKHTPRASLRARDYFEDSIRIDPDYALGYASLADMLSCSPMHTWVIAAEGDDVFPEAVMDLAGDLATRAIELDADLPEARTALGLVQIYREWNWDGAMASLDAAVAINPSFEFARRARALALASLGRLDEAQQDIDVALQVDPLNAMVVHTAASIHQWRGETERAVELYREAIELDAGNPLGPQSLGMWHCRSGETEEGLALLRQARAISQDDPLVVADLGYCLAISGRRDQASAMIAELQLRSTSEWVSPVALARIHVALGDHEAALAQLERATAERAYRVVDLGLDDRWDVIRDDPRFRDIVRRVGIVEPIRSAN